MAQKRKKKKTTYKQRSKRISRWRALRHNIKFFFKRGYYASLTLLVLSLFAWGWWWIDTGRLDAVLASAENTALQKTADSGLKIQRIYLDGRKHYITDSKQKKDPYLLQLEQALSVKIGDPIMAVPLEEIQVRLKEISWVHTASVERDFPGTLHVYISERIPVAIWQHRGTKKLVDADGVILKEEDANKEKYRDLLRIVGAGAPENTDELFDMLMDEPEILPYIQAAARIGSRRWDIHFNNEIIAKLPEKDAKKAWKKFARMQKTDQLLERKVRSVDLRLPGKVFIDKADKKTRRNTKG